MMFLLGIIVGVLLFYKGLYVPDMEDMDEMNQRLIEENKNLKQILNNKP